MESHDLQGNKKEYAGEYLREIGYEVQEESMKWFFGIRRIQAINKNIVK